MPTPLLILSVIAGALLLVLFFVWSVLRAAALRVPTPEHDQRDSGGQQCRSG
jgi:hypothetical protein